MAASAGINRPAATVAASTSCLSCFMILSPYSDDPCAHFCCMHRLQPNDSSMRERPQAQFLLGDLPQARQTMWFDNQEKDDQAAKQHELDMRHRGIGERQMQQHRQRRQDVIEKDRQQQDKAEPRNAPRMLPTPPMMIMNRIRNDRSSEKPSGS